MNLDVELNKMHRALSHVANSCHRGGIVMTREIASLGECRFRISNIHQNSMDKVGISTKSLSQNKHHKSRKTNLICN